MKNKIIGNIKLYPKNTKKNVPSNSAMNFFPIPHGAI